MLDDDHVGVLSRNIRDYAPPGLTITERNVAEEIDRVVTPALARSWNNAEERKPRRPSRHRRYMLKPVGEPYDTTGAYIAAHYQVD
ncbi:hypothetical protein ACFWYW_11030 [Nonomuraea sp. NPDC059023]|uniref:hypothetical protein n=1 Tax=unclassified Nonomuraea TaxID=2593643 RepID=UPI0036AE0711